MIGFGHGPRRVGLIQALDAMGFPRQAAVMFRTLVVATVCLGLGMIGSLVVFFAAAFVFAGDSGDAWVRWFFGANGYRFFLTTVILALVALPIVRRAKLRLV